MFDNECIPLGGFHREFWYFWDRILNCRYGHAESYELYGLWEVRPLKDTCRMVIEEEFWDV